MEADDLVLAILAVLEHGFDHPSLERGRANGTKVFLRGQIEQDFIALSLQILIERFADPITPETVQVLAAGVAELGPHLQPVRLHQIQRPQHPIKTRQHAQVLLGECQILMDKAPIPAHCLPNDLNDNKIINQLCQLQHRHPQDRIVLVSKDINMRLKARACGIDAEDYHTDQLLDDIALLARGYHEVEGSFWDRVSKVETQQRMGQTVHQVQLTDNLPALHINDFIIDGQGFVGWVKGIDGSRLTLRDMHQEPLLHQEAWGLRPRDIHQALAMYALLDPDIHLVNLTGAAGSGKTILALAAAIEQTMVSKTYRRIIATRSTQGLDEDIGFLPGTEAEKMEPWLGAITDNLEALHMDDECTHGSVDYILDRVPLQFKSLNYIRGRSFQQSFILIDESQNLTPHQIKTIITRAGAGSKVVCLGNLAQIDTPYLNATSSGLTYLTECFKDFPHGVHIHLQGVPRSVLAEYAETHL
jgi:PhoH-like ATPase